MWFSMWIILTIASFGIAWFPMIYYLIKRRNTHFSRQKKLEALVLGKLRKTKNSEKTAKSKIESLASSRNAAVWTFFSLLIFPAFYVFYFLKSDLEKHETQEHDFLVETVSLAKDTGVTLKVHGLATTKGFALGRYLVLSSVTFGLAAAYWLYRIFNDYNNHFKIQWKIEDELLNFLKIIDKNDN